MLKLLDKKPLDLIRRKEEVFKLKFKGQELSDDAWIKVMVENPILIERPIVVAGDKAWVARDEASLAEIRGLKG